MASVVEKSCMTRVCALPDKKENSIDKLQRQFDELQKRVDKYFDDLEDVEEMCKQAQEDVKRFQLKANVEKEIVKKDVEIQDSLFSEVSKKIKKAKELDVKPPEDKMPNTAQRALLSTTSGRVCRFVKIGCVLLFDTAAAYGLFKMTQPYFF